jgi:3-keto-disaccharide hydrolase
MKPTLFAVFGLVLLTLAGSRPAELSAQSGAFTTLLDGSTLKGWDVVGDANWAIVDKTVQATRGTGFLVTPSAYGDFQLVAEFWVTDDANSGIFIRCADAKNLTADTCYEVNIYDQRPDPAFRTGAIVNVAKPATLINTGGKWNTYDITAKGAKLTVTLNGTRTVDVEHSGHARGPIGLQYSAGTVKFRSVRIKTL